MFRNFFLIPFSLLLVSLVSCSHEVDPPAPVMPVPSPRQLAWQHLEFYAFTHFTVNTFTDKEWGYGDEPEKVFNPTDLDCNQWAQVIKDAGMKGIIVTAKHHDGFCLWPSKYTEHSVKNSPWKDGKGDVVKELSEACKAAGLKFGVYLSPWDRNSALYGTPEYITYYRNQLRELLTNYGPVFEVWFDGANGGTGYYGGAREERKIDRRTYYDWSNTRKIVRELQPDAVMFSDAGPDVRWVGNEKGIAGETNWSMINRDEFSPGIADQKVLNHGLEDGKDWVPAECDVSIRPGWFYHKSQDNKVKSVNQLVDIYMKSLGRNGSFLLNIPPDRTGRINEHDVQCLKEFRKALDEIFARNLAAGKRVSGDTWRGKSDRYAPGNLTDGKEETYWCTDDGVKKGVLTIDLDKRQEVNLVLLQEHIALGQRVKAFKVEVLLDGNWKEVAQGTTIGYKRILHFPPVKTDKIRVTIQDARACPLLNNIEVYNAPEKYFELKKK